MESAIRMARIGMAEAEIAEAREMTLAMAQATFAMAKKSAAAPISWSKLR